MRVGIMSMQRVVNHGSFMQAYGLKSMVESLGHDVVFVDYKPAPCVAGLRNGGERIKDWLGRVKADVRFTKAGRRLLVSTGAYKLTPIDVEYERCLGLLGVDPCRRNIGERVDTLIIGSDEVFNCTQAGPNVGFCRQLLGQGNNCSAVISYAGSFGHTTLSDLERFQVSADVKECFECFDAVSVRDENSRAILEALKISDVHVHLDPVLVSGVEKMSWKPVFAHGRYAVVYGYGNRFTKFEGEAIRAVARKRGVELLAVYGHQDFCDKNIDCGPDEILNYFKHAAFVVTDTFHGAIFSIISHTPFVVIKRSQNANKLTDLLDRLSLKDRLAATPEDISHILSQDLRFEKADEIRRAARESSIAYLRKSISVGGKER